MEFRRCCQRGQMRGQLQTLKVHCEDIPSFVCLPKHRASPRSLCCGQGWHCGAPLLVPQRQRNLSLKAASEFVTCTASRNCITVAPCMKLCGNMSSCGGALLCLHLLPVHGSVCADFALPHVLYSQYCPEIRLPLLRPTCAVGGLSQSDFWMGSRGWRGATRQHQLYPPAFSSSV